MALPKYSVLQIRPAKDSLAGQTVFIEFLASLRSSLRDGFWERFLGTFETISLEIVNLNQTTFFIISCPERMEALIKAQVAAQYPTALITPMKDYLPEWLNHGKVAVAQLTLSGPAHLSINSTLDDKVDQMASILGSLARIPEGQAVIIQICLFAPPKNWQKNIRGVLEKGIPSKDPLKPSSPHPQKAIIEKKLAYQAYSCDIRLAAITADSKLSSQLLSQIGAAFGTYSLSEGNSLSLRSPKNPSSTEKLKQMILDRSAKYSNQFQFLNYGEITSIYHLPGALLAPIKGIAWGKTLKGEAPINLVVDEGIPDSERIKYNFFAKTEFKSHMAVFGMKKGIDRLRHTYILGKSGTGKSTLIGRMAINDIQHGEGVAFVDPHGDAAETLLDFVPESRINDVAYLDPSVKGKSFWMNPLYVKNPEQGEMVASSIVSIFSKLYGNSWGPRLEYILRNTLLTLVYKPETTLADVPRILTNKDFREKECLVHVTDPVLVNFWRDEYDKYSEKFQTEAIAPILNKIGQFVTSPTIRDIINHPKSTVDFEDMMNTGKIIILNLPQGKIGEDNAALLGAMFISQIQIAAMNRANMAEEKRKDFFLYVDEFQNFATSSFVKILSEARKYRLGLILANQYIAQLPEEIQNAIFGNVGTVMSYVVGASDADRIMKELNNLYTADDLVGLGKYQLAMKMSVDSQMTQPFSSYALPLPDTFTHQKEKVLAATYERYYRKIEPMDMSQVTSAMTPAAKRFTEAPYVPKVAGKIDFRPQNNSSPRADSYTPKPQYIPQLGPQYQGKPPLATAASTPSVIPGLTRNPDSVPEKIDKPYFVPIPVQQSNNSNIPVIPGQKTDIRDLRSEISSSPKDPTKEGLNSLRKQGLRPSVVGCFLNDKKILLVYQKTFNLWQLPQGGIENNEELFEAFDKELSGEITEDFVKTAENKILVSTDKIEFPPSKQGLRDMKTDSGEEVTMKGKFYYFVTAQTKNTTIVTDATEFSDYKWLNFDESYKLIKETNTGGKLRIYTELLHLLKNKGLLSSNSKDNGPTAQTRGYSERPQYQQRNNSRPGIRPNGFNYNRQPFSPRVSTSTTTNTTRNPNDLSSNSK
jgi:8-oxo-dGTP pyrophosphatase MutT (NUDIX family)